MVSKTKGFLEEAEADEVVLNKLKALLFSVAGNREILNSLLDNMTEQQAEVLYQVMKRIMDREKRSERRKALIRPPRYK